MKNDIKNIPKKYLKKIRVKVFNTKSHNRYTLWFLVELKMYRCLILNFILFCEKRFYYFYFGFFCSYYNKFCFFTTTKQKMIIFYCV